MNAFPDTMSQADAVRAAAQAEGWMLDVDGCLVRTNRAGGAGGVAIDGAARLLDWLRRHGRPFVICTNASQRPAVEYARHLREIGLDIADGEMMTAATAAADHIALRYPGARVLALGDVGLEDALRAGGIETVPPDGPPAQVVVVGAADHYGSKAIDAACLAIAEHGAAFYVTVNTPWFNGGGGQRSVAISSAIAAAIAWVTGRGPQVCGKPSEAIGAVLRQRLGGAGRRLVVVGDMASIEMRLARQMGALGVLVMSGGTAKADLSTLKSLDRPHLKVADVGELFQHIEAIMP
jgi:HAD superfamily hydrolase (TIGR01450 family)